MAARKSVRPLKLSLADLPAIKSQDTPRKKDEKLETFTEGETSQCVVCSGVVSEQFEVKDHHGRHTMISKGFSCRRCGIKYEFLPPHNIKTQ